MRAYRPSSTLPAIALAVLLAAFGLTAGPAAADALDDALSEITRTTPTVTPFTLDASRADGELILSEQGDWMVEGRQISRSEARIKLADIDLEKMIFVTHPGILVVNGIPTESALVLQCRPSRNCIRGGYIDPKTSGYFQPWTRDVMYLDIRKATEQPIIEAYVAALKKAVGLLASR